MQDRKELDDKIQILLALEAKYFDKDRSTDIPFVLRPADGVYGELLDYLQKDLPVFAELAKWSKEVISNIEKPKERPAIFKDYISFQFRLMFVFNNIELHYKKNGYRQLVYKLGHGIEPLHRKYLTQSGYHFSWTFQTTYLRHPKIFHQIEDVDIFLTMGFSSMLPSIENAERLERLIPAFVENAKCPYAIYVLLFEAAHHAFRLENLKGNDYIYKMTIDFEKLISIARSKLSSVAPETSAKIEALLDLTKVLFKIYEIVKGSGTRESREKSECDYVKLIDRKRLSEVVPKLMSAFDEGHFIQHLPVAKAASKQITWTTLREKSQKEMLLNGMVSSRFVHEVMVMLVRIYRYFYAYATQCSDNSSCLTSFSLLFESFKNKKNLKEVIHKNDLQELLFSKDWNTFIDLQSWCVRTQKDFDHFDSKLGLKEFTEKLETVQAKNAGWISSIFPGTPEEMKAFIETIKLIVSEMKRECEDQVTEYLRNLESEMQQRQEFLETAKIITPTKTEAKATQTSSVQPTVENKKSTTAPTKLALAEQAFHAGNIQQALAFYKEASQKKTANDESLETIHILVGMTDCYRALAANEFSRRKAQASRGEGKKCLLLAIDKLKRMLASNGRFNETEVEQIKLYHSYISHQLGLPRTEADDNEFIACVRSGAYSVANHPYQRPLERYQTDNGNQHSATGGLSKLPLIRKIIKFPMFEQPDIVAVTAFFQQANIDFYFYGGCVRDAELALTSRDYDACVAMTLIELKSFLTKRNLIFKEYGKEHPIIELTVGEVVLQVSPGEHKNNYSYNTQSEEDLASFYLCDTTLNAMRYYPAKSELVCLPETEAHKNSKTIAMFANQLVSDRYRQEPALCFRAVALLSKLQPHGYQLHESLQAEIAKYKNQLNHFKEAQKRKCYIQMARPFLNGAAVAMFEIMQQVELLLPREALFVDIIKRVCEKLDAAYREDATPSLPLLTAALLLQPFHAEIDKLIKNKKTSLSEFHDMCDRLMNKNDIGVPHTSVSQRLKTIFILYMNRMQMLGPFPDLIKKVRKNLSYSDFTCANTLFDAHRTARAKRQTLEVPENVCLRLT